VEKVMNLDFTFERQLELTRKEARELGREIGLEEGLEEGRAKGREEGREEGRAEGREEGRIAGVISLLKKGKITLSEAVEELEMNEDIIQGMLKDEN